MTAPAPDDEEPEERQPGLAKERTQLAWTRTAISFAAAGAAILKTHLVPGLVVIALGVVTWAVTRLLPHPDDFRGMARRFLLITVTVTAVGVIALAVALTAHHGSG